MRKYYFKDASGQQQGPVKLDVLKTKTLHPETPIWYDPLLKWTTASEVDELKNFILRPVAFNNEEIKAPIVEIKEEPKPLMTVVEEPVVEKNVAEAPIVIMPVVETIVTEKIPETIIEKKIEQAPVVEQPQVLKVAEGIIPVQEIPLANLPLTEKATVSISSTASIATAPSISMAATSVQPARQLPPKKKNTAWLSWVLSILVLGAAGYYVYQDIKKNEITTDKAFNDDFKPGTDQTSNSTTAAVNLNSTTPAGETNNTVIDVPPVSEPVVTTLTTTTTNAAKKEQEKKILLKKKAEDDKKKQIAAQEEAARQQADDQRKKEIAAQELLAKELQFRNSWSKYITLGAFNYAPKGGEDGVNSFDIPVYNGTDAMIDRVVVKIEYYKKESKEKSLHTETVIITNIPPKSAKSGVAPENKRARVARGTITAVNSRKLHLCYPQSNGNSSDPYYCN